MSIFAFLKNKLYIIGASVFALMYIYIKALQVKSDRLNQKLDNVKTKAKKDVEDEKIKAFNEMVEDQTEITEQDHKDLKEKMKGYGYEGSFTPTSDFAVK